MYIISACLHFQFAFPADWWFSFVHQQFECRNISLIWKTARRQHQFKESLRLKVTLAQAGGLRGGGHWVDRVGATIREAQTRNKLHGNIRHDCAKTRQCLFMSASSLTGILRWPGIRTVGSPPDSHRPSWATRGSGGRFAALWSTTAQTETLWWNSWKGRTSSRA